MKTPHHKQIHALAITAVLLEVSGTVGIGFPQTLPDQPSTYSTATGSQAINRSMNSNDNTRIDVSSQSSDGGSEENTDEEEEEEEEEEEGPTDTDGDTDVSQDEEDDDNDYQIEYLKRKHPSYDNVGLNYYSSRKEVVQKHGIDDGNRPLETLKKLQAMLDETDYAVQPSSSTSVAKVKVKQNINQSKNEVSQAEPEQFWTSADRSKYRRKQKEVARAQSLQRQQQEQQNRTPQQELPISMGMSEEYDEIIVGNSSGDETDSSSALSSSVPTYTLPNLPVYLSDDDIDEEDETDDYDHTNYSKITKGPTNTSSQISSGMGTPPQQGQSPPYRYNTRTNTQSSDQTSSTNRQPYEYHNHPYTHQHPQYAYPYHNQLPQHGTTYYQPISHSQQQQQQQSHGQLPPDPTLYHPSLYPPNHPIHSMGGQVYPYNGASSSHANQYLPPNVMDPRQFWSQRTSVPYPHPFGTHPQNFPPSKSYLAGINEHRSLSSNQMMSRNEASSENPDQPGNMKVTDLDIISTESNSETDSQGLSLDVNNVASLAEAGALLSFDSVQKILFVLTSAMLLSYCSVSPRNLPLVQYNAAFKKNIQLLMLTVIPPSVIFFSVLNAQRNDINALVTTFYSSFTVGFMLIFILEMVFATFLRLVVFAFWEPAIFELTPKIPLPVLPWVLRSEGYRPKRITLFVADFAVSCVAAPIVEEFMKLKIVQWGAKLPKNYKITKKLSKKGKLKRVMEPIPLEGGHFDVTDINNYVSQLLSASLGLKLADSIRRVLMYTKSKHEYKGFYALCRGLFPIHELCGTMTALQLAKRDVLGINIPLWRMLLPSVFIHAMAMFRGMKPIYKWNSATPWTEMQLSPWSVDDDSTLVQIVNKGIAKLMWISILARVLGYCIKNYYMIGRQARKQATTYAGKRAAFLSELVADEMLKKSKKDDKK